jgi:hypothetical protein
MSSCRSRADERVDDRVDDNSDNEDDDAAAVLCAASNER